MPSLNKYIEPAYKSAEHLKMLIQDLLDMAQVRAGKFSLNLKDIKFKEILVELQTMLQFEADKRNIIIEINTDENIPEIVKTDPLRFKQIIINLVSNAI